MIRLSALNEDSSEESDPEPTQESIKQAKESEALDLYNAALRLQQQEDYVKAEEAYKKLLCSELVKEAPSPDRESGLVQPGQVLKYSAHKNLATMAEAVGELDKATEAYLEAVSLDDSDVTVWYHIGKVAMKTFDLFLARRAFEEGLRCNPNHWPCLDELCTVLYASSDYFGCLVMISKALERDEEYVKGLALKDKIFSEEPYMKRECQHMKSLFRCGSDIDVDTEEFAESSSQFVKEALTLRAERLKLIEADRADPPPVRPIKQLTSNTWACLGECFAAQYDHMTSPTNSQPLGRRIDLDSYYKAIVAPDISMSRSSVVKAPDYSMCCSFSAEGFSVYKGSQQEGDDKSKKGVKRKKPPQSSVESDFLPKRRSARVRTSKKKEEEVNYKEMIQAFLPFSMRPGVTVEDDSSQDSVGDGGSFSQAKTGLPGSSDGKSKETSFGGHRDMSSYEGVISGEAETLDVLNFVQEHMENGGLVDLMNQYGICLAAQCNKKWPPVLVDVFLKVYLRMRKHVILPPEFFRDDDLIYAAGMSKLVLVATELTLDKLMTAKSKSSSSLSPASSPRGSAVCASPIKVGAGFSSKYLPADVEYLHCISRDQTIHGDFTLEMAIRANWVKARYLMLQGQMDFAIMYLDRCSSLLSTKVSPLAEPISIQLVNSKVDNVIALDQVQKKLESLQRCRSLEEVHRLYESGLYMDVVQILMPTLHQPQPKTKASELGMSIPERPAQLLLLQDSLIKLKDYEQCLACSEVALNEAVSQMSPCEAWSTTLSRLFSCVNTIIIESKNVLENFPRERLLRLTQNLIKVIEASMYSTETTSDPPLATTMPWLLLCKVIRTRENDKKPSTSEEAKADPPDPPLSDRPVPETGSADTGLETMNASSDLPSLPQSLQFMHTAHENLGRRGWCCNNQGTFLLYYVDILTEEFAKPNAPTREELVRDLEQCFLCLYGHPSKKAKARGLQEHNSPQIELTWSNSAVVFDYFKPPVMPTFDSKAHTISAEVQNLLRRMTLVVPEQELEAISFESVQSFIEGIVDEAIPKLPEHLVGKKRPVVTELFYLLADFYFKNKEFSKALKYCMHDVCVQPDRADTWATMALARKSRVENKLNACEPKSAGPIQKHAISALRCFKRSVEIDGSNSSLWEEYGSLCYVLHSHASRQLRQFDQEELTADVRTALALRRQEMLLLSEKCFTSALGMEDGDSWLHHYMLGKIAEKLKKPAGVYLEHFQKSAKYLDEDISSYPKRIPFYSPPEHILEALEVYYRIHVSVIKLTLNDFPDVETSVLQHHLDVAAKGPFHHPELDQDTPRASVSKMDATVSESDPNTKVVETKAVAAKEGATQDGKGQEGSSAPETALTAREVLNSAENDGQGTEDSSAVRTESREHTTASALQGGESRHEASASHNERVPPDATPMDVDGETDAGEETTQSASSSAAVAMETDSEPASRVIEVGGSMEPSGSVGGHVDNDAANGMECSAASAEESAKAGGGDMSAGSDDKKSEVARFSAQQLVKSSEQGDVSTARGSGAKAETHEAMETDTANDNSAQVKRDPDDAKLPPSCSQVEAVPSPEGRSASLTAEQKSQREELLDRCLHALEYCLRRFAQHHKCRYRLAFIHFHSQVHKDLTLCRDLLLGSSKSLKPPLVPHHALFNEKTKTNLFSTFWRIPEEDIDRPGSFCTHTYKSTELLLEVLNELGEWDSLVLVSNLLHRTPEAGKKYLRDNERHHLARKACSYALEITKRRVSTQNPKAEAAALSQLVLDVYECYKTGQKYESFVKTTETLLLDAYEMLKVTKDQQESGIDPPQSLLDQALKFCQQTTKPQPSSSGTSLSQSSSGGASSDASAETTTPTDGRAATTAAEAGGTTATITKSTHEPPTTTPAIPSGTTTATPKSHEQPKTTPGAPSGMTSTTTQSTHEPLKGTAVAPSETTTTTTKSYEAPKSTAAEGGGTTTATTKSTHEPPKTTATEAGGTTTTTTPAEAGGTTSAATKSTHEPPNTTAAPSETITTTTKSTHEPPKSTAAEAVGMTTTTPAEAGGTTTTTTKSTHEPPKTTPVAPSGPTTATTKSTHEPPKTTPVAPSGTTTATTKSTHEPPKTTPVAPSGTTTATTTPAKTGGTTATTTKATHEPPKSLTTIKTVLAPPPPIRTSASTQLPGKIVASASVTSTPVGIEKPSVAADMASKWERADGSEVGETREGLSEAAAVSTAAAISETELQLTAPDHTERRLQPTAPDHTERNLQPPAPDHTERKLVQPTAPDHTERRLQPPAPDHTERNLQPPASEGAVASGTVDSSAARGGNIGPTGQQEMPTPSEGGTGPEAAEGELVAAVTGRAEVPGTASSAITTPATTYPAQGTTAVAEESLASTPAVGRSEGDSEDGRATRTGERSERMSGATDDSGTVTAATVFHPSSVGASTTPENVPPPQQRTEEPRSAP